MFGILFIWLIGLLSSDQRVCAKAGILVSNDPEKAGVYADEAVLHDDRIDHLRSFFNHHAGRENAVLHQPLDSAAG